MKKFELGAKIVLVKDVEGLPVGAIGEIYGGDGIEYDINFEFKSRGFNVPDKMVYNIPAEYIKMQG
jgi:hypothetical protein